MNYVQIKKAELVPAKFGEDIKITMVGLYDESNNDKWIRWVKLPKILDALKSEKIKITDELFKELMETPPHV